MNININEKQLHALDQKAREVNIPTQELLDMILEFFNTMEKGDIEFFVSNFLDKTDETDEEGCCRNDSCNTNEVQKKDSCCGGGCH